MRIKTLLVAGSLFATLIVSSAWAAAPVARPVVAKGGQIAFTFKQENVPANGGFSRYGGSVALDEKQPALSSVQMNIDMASVTAGSSDADSEVVKPGWLDVVGHPQATFTSKIMKSLGNGKWEATGPLTIKATTRDATVPFTVKEKPDGGAELTGEFLIKRGDYKVGEGEWSAFDTVANEVNVKFRVLLAPARK